MWLVIFFLGTAFAVACIGGGIILVSRLSDEEKRRENLRQVLSWLGKGVGLPLALWAVMNFGLSLRLQPFMPSVQAAKNSGGAWFIVYLGVLGAGMFAIASYWLAVTLGWTLFKVGRDLQGEARAGFRSLCLASCAGMLLPAMLLCYFGGWKSLGLAAASILLPIAGYAPSVLSRKKKPMYSTAIARMKFGKYAEAEWEIIRQLESQENDYDGWLMLAELYATRFHDVAAAEQIIGEVCDQPRATPSQISVALHKLADWHLKISDDPDAARHALSLIGHKFPGSHLARMAELRSRQLPRTVVELREQRTASTIPLPALSESFNVPSGYAEPAQDATQAARLAGELAERLRHDPNDVTSRERLARLLAESSGKADAAIEQIEWLLGLPDQPDGKRAEWLGLIASWQLRFKRNEDAARAILQRITRDFSRSPQALAAQRRLNLLDAGKKHTATPPPVPRPKIKIVPD